MATGRFRFWNKAAQNKTTIPNKPTHTRVHENDTAADENDMVSSLNRWPEAATKRSDAMTKRRRSSVDILCEKLGRMDATGQIPGGLRRTSVSQQCNKFSRRGSRSFGEMSSAYINKSNTSGTANTSSTSNTSCTANTSGTGNISGTSNISGTANTSGTMTASTAIYRKGSTATAAFRRGSTYSQFACTDAGMKRRRSSVTTVVSTKRTKTPSFKRQPSKCAEEMPYDFSNISHAIQDILEALPEGVIDLKKEYQPSLYVEAVVAHLRVREKKFELPEKLLHEKTPIRPSARAVLVDWLIQVQDHINLESETLHLSLALLDHMLSVRCIALSQVQLMGITCLFIASKMNERFPPKIDELLRLTEYAYKKEDLKAMERVIIKQLEFDVFIPTPVDFLDRYIKASAEDVDARGRRELRRMANFLLEHSLTDCLVMVQFPSLRAAAAIWLSRRLLLSSGTPVWTASLEFYSGFEEERVMEVVERMASQLLKRKTSKFQAAYEKYSSRTRHGCISKHPALDNTKTILEDVTCKLASFQLAASKIAEEETAMKQE